MCGCGIAATSWSADQVTGATLVPGGGGFRCRLRRLPAPLAGTCRVLGAAAGAGVWGLPKRSWACKGPAAVVAGPIPSPHHLRTPRRGARQGDFCRMALLATSQIAAWRCRAQHKLSLGHILCLVQGETAAYRLARVETPWPMRALHGISGLVRILGNMKQSSAPAGRRRNAA